MPAQLYNYKKMAFMTYLARHQHQQQQQQQQSIESNKHVNKRSQTLPTVVRKKKEIGDYILCRTIGRGASGKFSFFVDPFSFPFFL